MGKLRIPFFLYCINLFFVFLYSFTQVDLGLTLTRWPQWQPLQIWFQHIGYFDRTLSVQLFVAVIGLLFFWYIYFLKQAKKNKINDITLRTIVVATTAILFLSYNAFSYDLFNYVFDAKIVTAYHEIPWQHRALDYPGDPMLSFMHWTHRYFPYGPTWLLLTVPFSFIGMQLLLPTLLMFKTMIAGCFLLAVYFLWKILKKINPEYTVSGTLLFALNPLVTIESLVSSHNDIAMMSLALVSFYFLVVKKHWWALLFLALSIGVKWATLFLLPVYVFVWWQQRHNKQVDFSKVGLASAILMITAVVFASVRTTYQPWYLLYVLPFLPFIGENIAVFLASILMVAFSILEYAPFLYTGNWDPPIPTILFWMTAVPVGVGLILFLIPLVRTSKR